MSRLRHDEPRPAADLNDVARAITPAPPGRSDELRVALMALTVVTGLVDAVSFLGLGRVFTANMTGNVVFLGFALGGAQNIAVNSSLSAIGAFLIGAGLGGRLGKHYAGEQLRKWFLKVAVIESALLIGAGLISLGFDFETHTTAF